MIRRKGEEVAGGEPNLLCLTHRPAFQRNGGMRIDSCREFRCSDRRSTRARVHWGNPVVKTGAIIHLAPE